MQIWIYNTKGILTNGRKIQGSNVSLSRAARLVPFVQVKGLGTVIDKHDDYIKVLELIMITSSNFLGLVFNLIHCCWVIYH